MNCPSGKKKSSSQLGQAAAIGVMAMMTLALAIYGGFRYIGPKFNLTQQKVSAASVNDVTHKAILQFVARNYRLPCPADGSAAKGSANDGLEVRVGGVCTLSPLSNGVVPWKTLGISDISALDGYQRRIGYAVTANLGKSTDSAGKPPYQYHIPGPSYGDSDSIQVSVNGAAASKYAYVLISYGFDGAGAWLPSGHHIAAPSSTNNESANTQVAAFSGTGNFVVWPVVTTSGSSSYFDDTLLYETSAQLCQELNGAKTVANWIYCSQNDNNQSPATAASNTDGAATTASNSVISQTYSCSAGSNYCPGSTNSGSLSNTTSFVNLSGQSGQSGGAGISSTNGSLELVGGLGYVSVAGANTGGIQVGNSSVGQNGDWIGANNLNSCVSCFGSTYTPNYMIPDEQLIYSFTNSYRSFAFIDYLVDGGMQVQVDAYSGGTVIGNTALNSPTVNIVQPVACTSNGTSAGLSSYVAIGQNVTGTGIPAGTTVIAPITATSFTLSNNATAAGTGITLLVMPSPFTGSISAGSPSITGVSSTTGLVTGMTLLAPGIPENTTITLVGSTITMSQNATQTSTPIITAAPLVKVGTMIVGNGAATNLDHAIHIDGTVTSGSTSVTGLSTNAGLSVGAPIMGYGIVPGTTIAAIGTDPMNLSLTLSTAAILAAGTTTRTTGLYVGAQTFVTTPITGTTTTGSSNITNVSSTVGLTVGMGIAGFGIPAQTIITGISGTTISVSPTVVTTGETSVSLFPTSRIPVTEITGDVGIVNSTTISNVSASLVNRLAVGQYIENPNIPSGTTITAINGTSLTISNAVTNTQTGETLFAVAIPPQTPPLLTGDISLTTPTVIANVSSIAGLAVGQGIAAPGIPAATVITGFPTANSISISQSVTASATTTELAVSAEAPVTGITGDLTCGRTAVANVSTTAGITTGNAVSNSGVTYATTIAAVPSSTSLTLSQVATATTTGAQLLLDSSPPVTAATITGDIAASSSITNVPVDTLPGVGMTISGNNIPAGTIIKSVSGGTLGLTQAATLATTGATLFTQYSPCPGPQSAALTPPAGNGLYAAPNAYSSPTPGPIVQHLPVTPASLVPSQIWPEPATANSGTTSAGSNPQGLSGNYIDQRDNQFGSRQFTDDYGNVQKFNFLVFQVLPYVYTNGVSITTNGSCTLGGTFCLYGMLFEGVRGCFNDIFAGSCTMEGIDEWANPPVSETMDCSQNPT